MILLERLRKPGRCPRCNAVGAKIPSARLLKVAFDDIACHPGTIVDPGASLSIDQAAEFLAISPRGVYRLIDRGDLVTVKVGGCDELNRRN